MKTLSDILNRLQGVRKSPNGHEARCPAHDDRRQSLSIALGENGCVLLKCHAGCAVPQICAALDITVKDLFPQNLSRTELPRRPNPTRSDAGQRIAATYDYVDKTGTVLFQVVRLEPKDFRQRRRDANGDWVWNLEGVHRVLYRLPEVLQAIARHEPVLIVEGEQDADQLRAQGFVATCNPMGAGKWNPAYTATLRGAQAILIPDKDKPGREHAQAVAEALRDACESVKLLELPNLNGRAVKDATDYLRAGGTAETLRALIARALPFGSDPWLGLVEDAADILHLDLPPVTEIVEGLVAERSKLVIGSGSKSFKTWLTMHCALAIAHGTPFLGRATTRRRVLYCNLELKPQTFQRRIQAIAHALSITVDRDWLHHVPLRGQVANLSPGETLPRLGKLAEHVRAEVVVLDPLYKLNTQGDENSSRDQTLFFNQLDRLTTESGCTVILNDHFGKGNQSEKDPLDAIRGSSAKGGDVDAAMVLRKHQVDGCFRVDMVHRELPPVEPFCIGWDYPLMLLRDDLNPDEMKKPGGGRAKSHDPRALLTLIADTTEDHPISVCKWAELAGMKRETLRDYLPLLRSRGWIRTVGEGTNARQHITKDGKKAAA